MRKVCIIVNLVFCCEVYMLMIVMFWGFLFIGEFWIIDVFYLVKKMFDYGVDLNLVNDDGLILFY